MTTKPPRERPRIRGFISAAMDFRGDRDENWHEQSGGKKDFEPTSDYCHDRHPRHVSTCACPGPHLGWARLSGCCAALVSPRSGCPGDRAIINDSVSILFNTSTDLKFTVGELGGKGNLTVTGRPVVWRGGDFTGNGVSQFVVLFTYLATRSRLPNRGRLSA